MRIIFDELTLYTKGCDIIYALFVSVGFMPDKTREKYRINVYHPVKFSDDLDELLTLKDEYEDTFVVEVKAYS